MCLEGRIQTQQVKKNPVIFKQHYAMRKARTFSGEKCKKQSRLSLKCGGKLVL
jgi:hypothetical protein